MNFFFLLKVEKYSSFFTYSLDVLFQKLCSFYQSWGRMRIKEEITQRESCLDEGKCISHLICSTTVKDRLSEWKTHIRTQYHKCRRLFEIFWRAQKGMFFVTFIPQIHTSLLLLCDDNFVEWAFRKEIYFHPHALSLLFVVVVKKLSFQCQGSWWMRLNIQNVMTLSHFVNFKPRKGDRESFVVRFSDFFFFVIKISS